MTHFTKNFITSIILMIGLSYGAVASKSIDEYLHHNPEMALKLIVNQCIQDTNTNIDQAASLVSSIVYNSTHKDALFPNTLSVDQNPNVSLLLASMAIIAKSSEFPWSTVQTILPSYNDNNQDHSIIFCEMTQSLFKMNIADQNQGYTFDETMQYVLRNYTSLQGIPMKILSSISLIKNLSLSQIVSILKKNNSELNSVFPKIDGFFPAFSNAGDLFNDTFKSSITKDIKTFWEEYDLDKTYPLKNLKWTTLYNLITGKINLPLTKKAPVSLGLSLNLSKTPTSLNLSKTPTPLNLSKTPSNPLGLKLGVTPKKTLPSPPLPSASKLKMLPLQDTLTNSFTNTPLDLDGLDPIPQPVYKMNIYGHNITLNRPPFLDAASDELFTYLAEALVVLEKIQNKIAFQGSFPKLLASFDNYFVGTRFNTQIYEAAKYKILYNISLDQFKTSNTLGVSADTWIGTESTKSFVGDVIIGFDKLAPLTKSGNIKLSNFGFPLNNASLPNDSHMFRPKYELPADKNNYAYFIPACGYTVSPTSSDNFQLKQIRFEPNVHMENLVSLFKYQFGNAKNGYKPMQLAKGLSTLYRQMGKIFIQESKRLRQAQAEYKTDFMIWGKFFDGMIKGTCADEYYKSIKDYQDDVGIPMIFLYTDQVVSTITSKAYNALSTPEKKSILQNLIKEGYITSSQPDTYNFGNKIAGISRNDMEAILTKPIAQKMETLLVDNQQYGVPPWLYLFQIIEDIIWG